MFVQKDMNHLQYRAGEHLRHKLVSIIVIFEAGKLTNLISLQTATHRFIKAVFDLDRDCLQSEIKHSVLRKV